MARKKVMMPLRTSGSPPVMRSFSHAQADEGRAEAVELLERQEVRLGQEGHVLGHAVDAAEVAAVGDRDAQVGDRAGEGVDKLQRHGEKVWRAAPALQGGSAREGGADEPAGDCSGRGGGTTLRARVPLARFRPDSPSSRACCDVWAEAEPDRVAIVHLGDGGVRRWTYGELKRASDRLANAFRAQGIGRGDRVAILLPQRPEVMIVHFAAMKCGASCCRSSRCSGRMRWRSGWPTAGRRRW